jgi:hypothetical protein
MFEVRFISPVKRVIEVASSPAGENADQSAKSGRLFSSPTKLIRL